MGLGYRLPADSWAKSNRSPAGGFLRGEWHEAQGVSAWLPVSAKPVAPWSKLPSKVLLLIRFQPPVEWHREQAPAIDPWWGSRWQSLHLPKGRGENTMVGEP